MPSSDSRIFSDRSRARAAASLALVCLPALLLAAVGFLYLRHEIAIAENELRDHAHQSAARMAFALNERWAEFLREKSTRNRMVRAVFPDPTDLSYLWPSSAESRRQGSKIYRQALELASSGDTGAATKTLQDLLNAPHAHWTESGLLLEPLILYQLAKLAPSGENAAVEQYLRSLLEVAVEERPSPVTEPLLVRVRGLARERGCLEAVDFDAWWERWTAGNRSRKILAPHLERDLLGGMSWQRWIDVDGVSHHVVGIRSSKPDFLPLSLPEIEQLAGEAVYPMMIARQNGRIPLTFGILYERREIWPAPLNREDVREAWYKENRYDLVRLKVGASLAGVGGTGPFGVRAQLADRDAFYSAIRKRTLWLGGFLTLAVGCTGLGAWRTWRAMEKQRELNRQQSDFISSVSHELRAPVASIRLLGELLASGKAAQADAEKRGEYAQLIERESGRLSALVDNVLDLSRIGRGTKQYQFEPTAVAALVRDSVERMEPLAAEQGVEISVEINPPADDPEVDPVAIQQALTNLLDNAIKFSPRDSTIAVSLKVKEAGGFEIAVRDEGSGIPEGEQERIFERFYRIGSELRRETEGIGIGLSLVRHIMEAHGGRVEVDSAPGEGSTFTLVFPEP